MNETGIGNDANECDGVARLEAHSSLHYKRMIGDVTAYTQITHRFIALQPIKQTGFVAILCTAN